MRIRCTNRCTSHGTSRISPVLALFALVLPAAGDILEEDFNGPLLDLDLWSVFDQPGNGANINQTNDRLEFSTIDDLFGGGQAAIYGNSWALGTGGDFQLIIDHNLTVGNPGATATGLRISLFSGSPDPAFADDRIDLFIYRWGTLFWVEWGLTANGSLVQNGFTETDANIGALQIFYSAAGDWLTIQSLDGGGGDDPISAALTDIKAWTDADCFQLYLGGFMNGLGPSPVNGSDAWYDDLLANGTIVDPESCSGTPGECPDTNGDAVVDITDVIAIVIDWGTDGSANNADIDGSGLVDINDLLALVNGWGPCPL